ncbi:E3 ubiquitin-protein ligase pellino 1 [Araneus ventricosus]|uniref:E3 ubiquitin-protein ligase pellino 1 n=1 Tax=Araneus ventricosus TaxID=182803 RepID=A0A4Y2AUH3_ARAVE|nr:E3 ubiquitin-protein ligase pellino 1 [Araneus ventricosus]
MFVQKVLSWIVPLEEAKAQRNGEDEDISSVSDEINEEPEDFDQASDPSFGTLTSILEPDRNPADLHCSSEDVELAEKHNHRKDKKLMLVDNAPSCNSGYSDVNHRNLRKPVLATSDSRQNASTNNILAEYEDPRAAGGDFTHYPAIAECHPKSVRHNASQANIESMARISKPRKSVSVQTVRTKRVDSKCNDSLKPLPVTSGPLKKALVNLDAFFSKDSVLESDKYSVDPILYGELLVLGCNGSAPQHLQRQMKSRFTLRKRYHPNGVKEAFSFVTNQAQPLSRPLTAHTVSFNVSTSRSVVVEYARDKSTDMFQIGRYESSPVDIRVVDLNQARNGVSRFACRIIVERHGAHQARVYAAAFDATGNIFLGECAAVCVKEGKMDGFTTNGVLILHPNSQWREISVCGNIYPLRSPEVEPTKRPRIVEESNVLQDGTLIDLCGVTLLWRSKEGLVSTPNEECLKRAEGLLQEQALECHLLPHLTSNSAKDHTYVFMSCGHLMRLRVLSDNMEGWSCPVCRCVGPIAELKVGKEPGFYVDRDFPSFAFRPCGHVTTLKTAEYWSAIKVPEHRNIQEAFCPFCATKLNSITKYVELAYPQ